MSEVEMRCRCNLVITPTKRGDLHYADCDVCNVHVTSTNPLKLRAAWRQKFGCTASKPANERWEKNAESGKKKQVLSDSIEEFADRVSAETRKRMLDENRKSVVSKFGIQYTVSDEKLDKFSSVKIEDHPNGKYQIVMIGPAKKFLVNKSGEIFSKNQKERYGTLETADDWDWSSYYPCIKDNIWRNKGVSTGTLTSNNKRKIIK